MNYSSSASRLATALLDPCMLLFLPVAWLTPARPYQCPSLLQGSPLKGLISALCLPVAKLTAARPHQCPVPPCCKASCLDHVRSGLVCVLYPLRQLRTLRAVRTHSSAVVCGLVWSVFYTQPSMIIINTVLP